MEIRALLIASSLLVGLPLGCGDTSTPNNAPVPPSKTTGTYQPKKTERGNVIKKHTLPTGADPAAIAPGP